MAAKAAVQRLAQVMASQTAAGTGDDEEDQEDNLAFRFPVSSSRSSNNHNLIQPISIARTNRSPSPALGRNFVEHTPSVRSTSAGRPSTMSVRTKTLMPHSRPAVKTPISIPPIEPPSNRSRDKRLDLPQLNSKDAGDQREASALHDELDMLQEENENLLDKVRSTLPKSTLSFSHIVHDDEDLWLSMLRTFVMLKKDVRNQRLDLGSLRNSNNNILGRGGFGKVYKGRLADGTLVAVKRLKEERTPGGELQFQTEVEMISMVVHVFQDQKMDP